MADRRQNKIPLDARGTALKRSARQELYRRDFERFGKEQLRIKTIVPGELSAFDMNDGQRIFNAKIERQLKQQGYVRAVLYKIRQLGGSTYAEARGVWNACLTKNFSHLLVALDDANTSKIFDMARTMVDHMSPDIRPLMRYATKRELVFENPDKETRAAHPGLMSRMDFQASKAIMAGTGTTRQGIHASEIAKWGENSIETLKSSLMPTLHRAPGTWGIFESTAYITGTYFRELCEMANSGKTDYIFCFIPWWLDSKNRVPLLPGEKIKLDAEERLIDRLAKKGQPEYEIPPYTLTPEQWKFRRCRISDVGPAMYEQEYPRDPESGWVNLDSQVFDLNILHEMRKDLKLPVRMVNLESVAGQRDVRRLVTTATSTDVFRNDDYIAIWKEPEPRVEYDIGADVASGIPDGAWSVAQVIRRDTREQVAEYHKHIDPVDYGIDLYWLGRHYNWAHIGVEMENVGIASNQQLGQMGYQNLYIWRQRERAIPTLSSLAGWKTQQGSKQIMVGNGRHLVLHRDVIVRSKVLHEQLCRFVQYGFEQYGAASGHDDAAMGWLIALQIGADELFGMAPTAKPIVKETTVLPPFVDDYEMGREQLDGVLGDMLRGMR